MPERLRDRADLIALVARKSTVPSIRRACLTGKVEVLGGFDDIPPSLRPGWILRITAKHGTEWLVAVVPDDVGQVYRVQLVEQVHWENWAGRPLAGAAYSIYQGDWPARYDARRDLARRKLKYDPTDTSVCGFVR